MRDAWSLELPYVERRPTAKARQWLGPNPEAVDLETPDGTVHADLEQGDWVLTLESGAQEHLTDEEFHRRWEPQVGPGAEDAADEPELSREPPKSRPAPRRGKGR